MADHSTQLESWLHAELDRIWLLAERRLRRMQAAGVKFPSLDGIEVLLAARKASRKDIEIDRALALRIEQLATLRPRVPLGKLVARLALRPIEADLIVVAIAPLIDPPLAELLQLIRSSQRRGGIDLALVGELFELDRVRRVELLQTVEAERPIVRWGLLVMDGPRELLPIHRPLHVVADVIATLCGDSDLPPSLVPHATLRRAPASLDDLVLTAAQRTRIASLRIDVEGAPWFVVWGPQGAGRREIATRLAASAQRPALVFDPTTCLPDELAPLLRVVQREALVRNAVLVIGAMEPELLPQIARALRRYPDAVILAVTASTAPKVETDHPVHELALGPLARPEAEAMWARTVGDAVDTKPLVAGFRLTPGDILAAARTAGAIARAEQRPLAYVDLRRGIDQRLRAQLAGGVDHVAVTETWNDLVMHDADLDRLREFINRKRFASVVYDEWGLAERIRYGKGLIALFSGPPGTGKTMVAGVIARELDLELYRVDLSQVVSKWAGETEKHLARVFEVAERTQAVLLFDEADALFGKRGEIEGGNDRYANLTVNYLLQRLESYTGVAVLTTNKEAALDDALQRRLSLHLRLQLPEVAERQRLWRSFLPPQLPGAASVDVAWLARKFELSGGSIKNAAVRAAFLAAGMGSSLDLAIVVAAVERELDDMGRVVWETGVPVSNKIDVSDVLLD